MDQSQNPSQLTSPSTPPQVTPATDPNANAASTGATPPPNKSKTAIIVAALIFVVLLIITAMLTISPNTASQTLPVATPTIAVQENTAPTLEPTMTVVEEVDSVDTEASDSSTLQEVEKDINSLQ